MLLLVLEEVREGVVPLAARGAHVRPGVGVDVLVLDQALLAAEALGAEAALVRLVLVRRVHGQDVATEQLERKEKQRAKVNEVEGRKKRVTTF